MAEIRRVIFRAFYCDKKGNGTTIDFKKRMSDTLPIPVIKEILLGGVEGVPVSLLYKEVSEKKNTPINGSEMTFTIVGGEDTGFNLKSLYTQNETEWLVEMYGAYTWSGFVIPDSCSEPFSGSSYEVTIRATDRLGVLKDVPYRDGTLNFRGFDNDLKTLQRALAFTGLSLNLVSAVNTFEISMNFDVDPMTQTYADNLGYADSSLAAYSCYDVIESVLKRWSAQLHQVNGMWQVVNVLEKSSGAVSGRIFSPSGTFIENVTIGNERLAGGMNTDIRPTGSTMLAKAISQSTAYYNYGYASNKLVNGDFQDNWPSPLTVPPGWTVDGNLTSAKGISQADARDMFVRLSRGAAGNNNPGWLVGTEFQVRAGEIVEVSFDLLAETIITPFERDKEVMFYVKDDKGKYFGNSGWVNGFADYHIRKKASDFRNQININVKIDPQDSDYRFTIGLRPIIDFAGDRIVWPTSINNVNARPTLAAGYTTPPLGEFTVNKSLQEQTYKDDPISIIHSDDLSDQRTSSLRINNIAPTRPLEWVRRGYREGVALLTTIANTDLTIHQRPYNVIEFRFNGAGDVDVNTLLSIDSPDYPGQYVFLSGTFDLMGGHHELRYAEVITDKLTAINTIGFESIITDYGDLKDKTGTPVGTPNGGTGGGAGGIIIDVEAFIKNQSTLQTGANFNVETGRANSLYANYIESSGNIKANSFLGNLNGGIWNDSAFMRFHWQGLGGQPQWLWGGSAPGDMYVYNPSNFSVDNSAKLGSVTAAWSEDTPDAIVILKNNTIKWSGSSVIKNWLGLSLGGIYHQYNTFTANADTVPENTSNFSYALNAPWNGYLGHFGANGYGLQLSSDYGFGNHLSFRSRNGDGNKGWNTWRELIWNGYIDKTTLNGGLVVLGGTGTDYNTSELQIQRTGSAPVLSFHWAGQVASTMTIETSGRIAIKNNPGTGYEDFAARDIAAIGGWFRSEGSVGWVNQTYGGGIYMIDSDWVRVYNSKRFLVENQLRATKIESTTDGFKSYSNKGLAGCYDEANAVTQVIWTIGNAWNSPESLYGIGYEYEVQPGMGHTVMYREAGVTNIRLSLSSGRIVSKSGVESMNFVQGQVGGTGFRIDGNGNAEVDSLVVRKELKVTTLNIREIIGTGGAFAVTNTFKVSSVTDNGSYYVLAFDNSNGTIGNQLRGGDIIRCQIWDGAGVKYYSGRVDSATGSYIVLVKSAMSGSGIPAVGDVLFQFGSDSDSNRQGAIYLTNSDPGAPYIDVMDGISSDNWAGKTKVRLGKLNGLTGTFWGTMNGYGLYADNVYLSNGYFSGTVNVTGGNAETITGSQTKVNALRDSLGGLAYDNIVERAKLGVSVIQGGYIVTDLLNVGYIQAQTVTAGYINTLSLDASAIRTGTLSADRIDTVALQAQIVTAGYINTLTLDASAIRTGKLSADRIDVDNIVAKKLAATSGYIAGFTLDSSILSGNNLVLDGSKGSIYFATPSNDFAAFVGNGISGFPSNNPYGVAPGIYVNERNQAIAKNVAFVVSAKYGFTNPVAISVQNGDLEVLNGDALFNLSATVKGNFKPTGAVFSNVVSVSNRGYIASATDQRIMVTGASGSTGPNVFLPNITPSTDGNRLIVISNFMSTNIVVQSGSISINIQSSAGTAQTVQIPGGTTKFFSYSSASNIWFAH